MATLTDKDLEQKREKNAKLREQIAEQGTKAASVAQDQTLQIEAAQLDAETARLEAQLAAAKEAAKVSVAKEGAAAPLALAKEQLKAAQSGVTPPGVAVDTNADAKTTADTNTNEKAPAYSDEKTGGNS